MNHQDWHWCCLNINAEPTAELKGKAIYRNKLQSLCISQFNLLVDSFLNHLLLLLLFHLLSQDCSPFLRASNQVGTRLQYIFYLYFKADLIMQSFFTPKLTNYSSLHGKYLCSIQHPKKRNPRRTLHSAEGRSIFICF